MKITTWNVNGLRAAYRNQANSWWEENKPDVLCLQEIRARPEQLTQSQLKSLKEQEVFWHPAERPGYSGVAALCREKPLTHQIGMGVPHFDREGRVIELDYPDFTIFNLYVPNGQRDLARLVFKLDFYRSLLEKCNQLHQRGQKLILCGDFNTAHRQLTSGIQKQTNPIPAFYLKSVPGSTNFWKMDLWISFGSFTRKRKNTPGGHAGPMPGAGI